MHHATLPETGTDRAWRHAARDALGRRIPPGDILWHYGNAQPGLFVGGHDPGQATPPVRVPRAFVDLAATVCWHVDPERFARLYAFLWRLKDAPKLISDRGDTDLARLRQMEKNVRRCQHKMKAFVRFREIAAPVECRRQFAAWFEPSHHTVEPTAPFFARRFADMDWMIVTPGRTARFERGLLTFHSGQRKPPFPEDATEELWGTYFRNIFNPARLKVQAMTSEMPRKYWKNLPEARHIPELIATAEARVSEMRAAAPTLPPTRAARIRTHAMTEDAPPPPGTQEALKAAIDGCTRCPLYRDATQAVPGEGPLDAEMMIVGEQPGDREDLAGRPFVGPAGQIFDSAAEAAGIDRSRIFVTNAVKHFKFTPRGKRRIHQKPNSSEISHCKWWLEAERSLVEPRLIVALGGSAAEALTGSAKGILKRRGAIETAEDGTPVFLTIHPSYLLRLPSEELRAQETERFRQDLASAQAHLEELRAA